MARKDALLRLHQSLIAKRDALRQALANDLQSAGAPLMGGDIGDSAAEGAQHELHSQLAALESRELTQIEQAIQLIREGRYGLCEACGGRIPITRLKALPFTILCIRCQKQQELFGRGTPRYSANWEQVSELEGVASEREITLSDLDR